MDILKLVNRSPVLQKTQVVCGFPETIKNVYGATFLHKVSCDHMDETCVK